MLRPPESIKTPVSILLVDDDPGAIKSMNGLLAAVGDVRFATNGRDGLRLAQEATPDLILLDAEMPGMSGFELEGITCLPPFGSRPRIHR